MAAIMQGRAELYRLIIAACIGVCLCLSGQAAAGDGARIFGVISDRSAAEVAAGANRFLERFPENEVVLRTPEQLADKPDGEVVKLWRGADAVLVAAVFGDEAPRLARLLREHPPARDATVFATNSSRQLVRLSRISGERVLEDLSHDEITEMVANPDAGDDAHAHLKEQKRRFPAQRQWLIGRTHYQGRSPESMDALMRWLLVTAGNEMQLPEPEPRQTVRYYRDGEAVTDAGQLNLVEGPAVALLDLDSGDRPGDRDLLDSVCAALEARDIQCFAVLARWGGGSVAAVEQLAGTATPAELAGVLSLQDFTVGGGEGRRAVTEALEKLDVPVIKGVRLPGDTEAQWRLGDAGIPRETVHYKIAMPELQGISQPHLLAVAQPPRIDERTGIRLTLTRPVNERVEAVADRFQRWKRLRYLDNHDKRIALVYYNHPPGRQNIGADKLDVPESLFEMLQRLQAAGYNTGELPEDAEALHDRIQERGVNLPEDRRALEALAGQVPSLSRDQYQAYFDTLPEAVRAELEQGPVGYLHARLAEALERDEQALGTDLLDRRIEDLRHMLGNLDHAARERAMALLDQFEAGWRRALKEDVPELQEEQPEAQPQERLAALRDALVRTGIPGLTGWGKAPGEAMVRDGEMLFPGLRFGNVFIGPQPPRGWEVDEALLHANTSFPPTHHYTGFYHWLRDHFEADALVYVGRHSTREFLPRRRAGLASDDYPDLLGGDLPVIYPYIVDGVGEGIQAKRRAMGVIISHLTPPLATTELYDELLELRQLVETFEAATDPDSPTRSRSADRLRERIAELDMEGEIERELARGHHHDHGPDHEDSHDDDHHDEHDEHDAAGHDEPEQDHERERPDLDTVDDELLVHEVGHYLTHMQERFMPLGLHVFGRDWDDGAQETMLASMAGDDDIKPQWREELAASPRAERENWLAALAGRFVPPGQGNDPVRTPNVLPTGRNFHALSSDLVPTRVAWSLGSEMAAAAREDDDPRATGSEALVLWASDTVRDEGVIVAFGLDMLGIRPEWNARGIVEGLERRPLGGDRDNRRDLLFTTSGLFRDLYEDQLVWLDRAARLALDGASETIEREHPALVPALRAALAPLPGDMRDPGNESLADNRVAARWVEDVRQLLQADVTASEAGRRAALRVFGTAPGAYGAGVNRLADRSGAWQEREELGAAYIRRMGHAYGAGESGTPAHAQFESRLAGVDRTYLGRASHLYGLLDNDDGFDFQGGLSVAVETITGRTPENRVLMHADADNARVLSLEQALMGELRGRNLNPQWIEPLMEQGYAGARTMAADFLDNLWGWQATSPEVVRSRVWDEVHDVYFNDRHELGLDEFLGEGHNVHVKTHMQATALVAAHRDFWDADPEVLQALSERFAELVVEHGLPGSGHTRPDHPMLDEVAERLDEALGEPFNALRAATQIERGETGTDPSRVTELQPAREKDAAERDAAEDRKETTETGEADGEAQVSAWQWLLAAMLVLLLAGGFMTGRRR